MDSFREKSRIIRALLVFMIVIICGIHCLLQMYKSYSKSQPHTANKQPVSSRPAPEAENSPEILSQKTTPAETKVTTEEEIRKAFLKNHYLQIASQQSQDNTYVEPANTLATSGEDATDTRPRLSFEEERAKMEANLPFKKSQAETVQHAAAREPIRDRIRRLKQDFAKRFGTPHNRVLQQHDQAAPQAGHLITPSHGTIQASAQPVPAAPPILLPSTSQVAEPVLPVVPKQLEDLKIENIQPANGGEQSNQ